MPRSWCRVLLLLLTCCGTWMPKAGAQAPAGRLKVLSYNLLEGLRADSGLKELFGRWVDTLQPDVLALQEVNHMTHQSFRDFAARLGYPYAVLLKEKSFPVALASRYPIRDVERVDGKWHHGYVYGRIGGYHFFVVHLDPFSLQQRQWEVGQLLQRVRALPDTARVLVMGDFNALSPEDSTYYESGLKLQLAKASEARDPRKNNLQNGRLDYSVVQAVRDAGLADSWKLLHGAAYQRSAPSQLRFHYNFSRIDYIWVSRNLVPLCRAATIVKDAVTDRLSDHYPMVLVLDNQQQQTSKTNHYE